MVRPPSRRTGVLLAAWAATVAVAATALTACATDAGPTLVIPTTTAAPPSSIGTSQQADPACAAIPIGTQVFPVEAGGAQHTVRIMIPRTFTGARSAVVIDFHGLGSDGDEQAAISGYEDLGNEVGFIVVHPTGVPNGTDSRTAWQIATSPADATHDDLGFANALIDDLIANWCGDPSRIYLTGFSNGGFFTTRLVCALADRIAAAVAVGGVSHPDTCAPTRVVPLAAFHGTADELVPFTGDGNSPLAGDPNLPTEFSTSNIPAEFAEFAAGAGCDPTPVDTPFGTTMIRHAYEGCRDGSVFSFVEMIDGGHVWPRTPDWPLDATSDGWAFMSQFRL